MKLATTTKSVCIHEMLNENLDVVVDEATVIISSETPYTFIGIVPTIMVDLEDEQSVERAEALAKLYNAARNAIDPQFVGEASQDWAEVFKGVVDDIRARCADNA